MRSEKLISQQSEGEYLVFDYHENEWFEVVRRFNHVFFDKPERKREEDKRDIDNLYALQTRTHGYSSKQKTLKLEMLRLFVELFLMRQNIPLKQFMGNLEKSIILRALSKTNGNQKEAAKFLSIKSTTLNEKIKKYKIRFQKKPMLSIKDA
ncbi:MAG: helix-turn-helix domain-containing protein [Candidatus Aminicenantaceae bacterium]